MGFFTGFFMICIDAMERSPTALDSGLEDLSQNWLGLFQRNLCLNKTENTFSLQSVSQNFQYTNFPINRVHKFPKVEDTQLVQCPSHLSCPMSKFPKLSKPKLLKAQVTQSSSHPKLKSPKAQVTQSPSCPNCQKSELPPYKKWLSHGQEYLWPCNSQNCF